MSGNWLTPAQVAHELGVTPARVRQMTDAGQLDCQRTPLGRLIPTASVARMLAQRRAPDLQEREGATDGAA